jgi:hypothetical protein
MNRRRHLVLILAAALVGGGLLCAWRMSLSYRRQLQGLRPADVSSIKLESEQVIDGRDRHLVVTLNEQERSEFLRLLGESRFVFPNHPAGGWTCFARITTADREYCLPVQATANNGTLISLYSRGMDGWNYGTLRNDALQPFVVKVLANHTLGTNLSPAPTRLPQ